MTAFVDEMATSAAFGLACTCDEIIVPGSGFVGSIGVISTMVSYAENMAKLGIQCVVITSGARKADGHPNVPISDGAQKAERQRVDDLAKDFFKMASKARGLSVDEVRGFEAGLFVGKRAVRAGLADAVMNWSDLAEMLRGGW